MLHLCSPGMEKELTMNTFSRLSRYLKWGSNRGIALVYVALLLIALLAFVGLAVDMGYMYITKTELQNAADSAALAGASTLKYLGPGGADPNDLKQSAGRAQAIAFAALNKATKVSVAIENNDSNVLGADNDITVGHWNDAFKTYSANKTPVNAMQVRARRTEESPGLAVNLFIGRVFGRDKMGVSADAIAALPLRANSFISFCSDTCTGMSSDPQNPTIVNRIYDRNPTTPGVNSFAWTSLLVSISSANAISPMVCNESPNEPVCGKDIWTTQGQVTDLFKDMESVFNDPNHDRENKTFDVSGTKVIEWRIIVPVTQTCNPGNQPKPMRVTHYAFIWVQSVCDTGGGQACRPYRSNPCSNPGRIVVSKIACVACADITKQSGMKTILVK